jgi:uncharacterized membrane protein YgdD (TMEM256/DUF423 family)
MSIRIARHNRSALMIAGVVMFLAVMLGAFGAHGLESKLSAAKMKTFQTGIRYHFYHGFGLYLAIILSEISGVQYRGAFISFLVGILLFSFNCYLYAITGIKAFAMIVPVGGVAFMIGWILMAVKQIRSEA